MAGSEVFVLIGAGSTIFTPGLLRDVARSARFSNAVVRLVDPDGDSAETMAKLGRRYADAFGSRMRVEAYQDRRQALTGATFVTTTIAVGSATARRRDFDIPARYGIQQTVGDTVGPGGVLRALRHIPELVRIAQDVAERAPGAWLLNYSNPLTANVRAIRKFAGVAAIGLCHGTLHTKAALAEDLGLKAEDVQAVFAGINHLCWLLDLRSGRVDLYPRLRQLVRERSGGRTSSPNRTEGVHSPVSADLMETFGLYPAPGDRHVAEFFGSYLTESAGGGLAWGLDGGRAMSFENMSGKGELWERIRAQAAGTSNLDLESDKESERLVSIAGALSDGPDQVELAVNLPNDGKIPNLPRYAIVEVPAVVGPGGVTGLAIGRLPDAIAAVLSARVNQQELTADAAMAGDRTLALQALVLDPLVPDAATAESILDDAVAADPSGLGRFAR